MLLLLLACGPATEPSDRPTPSDDSTPTSTPTDVPSDVLPWDDDPCVGVTAQNDWSAQLDRWDAQGRPSGTMLVTGSSSMRRWEHARRDLAAWGPVQRGLGGAWLSDLAVSVGRLAGPETESVLVFAGTNDLAGGSTVDQVVDRYRCFVENVFDVVGPVPVVFVGITPTPSRWAGWQDAEAVNDAVRALAREQPLLGYADVPTPFLAAGRPPPDTLFVDDRLHLSLAGYALWTQAILEGLHGVDPCPAPSPSSTPVGRFYVRVDLGPSNPDDGAPAPAVDALGIHWNAWHPVDGDAQVLAGEVLRDLVTTTGDSTAIGLVISGGFRVNGFANGGLVNPDGALLETMALPEATGDFFYTGGADDPGGLTLYGLDPARRYTLRLFASRADAEARSTRYTVRGAGSVSTVLVTSGSGVGQGGGDGNDGTVAVLGDLEPDPYGELHLDVAIETGSYAYLSLLELEAQ